MAGVLRTDLLARLNDLLQINYTKIEQYGSDGAYFQILDFIYDTKPFHVNLWTLNSLSRRCPDVLREDECTTRVRGCCKLQDHAGCFQGAQDRKGSRIFFLGKEPVIRLHWHSRYWWKKS